MYQLKPEIRIVYLLRNPLERIVSNYRHDVRIYKKIGKTITDDFNTRLRTRPHLLDTSLYFKQLKRYLDFFPAEQIHVLLYEDLLAHPDETLAALTRFLRVDDGFKFRTNYNARQRDEIIFSPDNFTRVIQPIKQDIAAMEDFLGRSLNIWDLSKERWCQAEGVSKGTITELK